MSKNHPKGNVQLILIFVAILCTLVVSATLIIYGVTPRVQEKMPSIPTNEEIVTEIPQNIEPFVVTDTDYSAWVTYTNKTHNFTLKYPKTWKIDSTNADNKQIYTPNSGDCCNSSDLTITNGSSTWTLSLDTLYTGGDGIDEYSFYDRCFDKNGAKLCSRKWVGPFEIAGIDNLYQRIVYSNKEERVLALLVQSGMSAPTIEVRKYSQGSTRQASITYWGETVHEDLGILNKITASIEAEKFE